MPTECISKCHKAAHGNAVHTQSSASNKRIMCERVVRRKVRANNVKTGSCAGGVLVSVPATLISGILMRNAPAFGF